MRALVKPTLALAVLVAAACAEPPAPLAPSAVSPPPEPVVGPAPPPREDGRLPALARPERYALALTVDPTQATFRGTTRILTTVLAPTAHLVLHAASMQVKSAVARIGARELAATVTPRRAHGGKEDEELLLSFASVLPAGPATLTLEYEAPYDDALAGLYHLAEGSNWYAFTQFEATDARRAFPCFDEPGFKVPFDLALTVPKGMIAVANTPETSRRDDGATTTFTFATTPPLPTYLVAFAVGDLDVRAGPTAPVPIRLIATKGKGALGQLAIDAAAGLTRELARYFQIAYPYPKLDIVAVPNFSAGAMENAGLVTFREELLLVDPAHPSTKAVRDMTITVAHELAHQWFGDLVTMAWWNDLWLNEGFATWAETKITDLYKPSFEAGVEHAFLMSDTMDTDSLASARAVRQPVTTTSEAEEAFDDLTYEKGASVLSMIEHSIGDAVFQKGIHAYLEKNAWKNATADDLLRALDEASGKDVTSLASSFLDRPGLPNVAVTTSCDGASETISLQQSPWLRLGQEPAQGKTAPWWVPVGVTSSLGERAAKLLSGPSDQIRLTKCAPSVFPNTDLAGYYRFSQDERAWAEGAKGFARLDTIDRVGFLSNLWAQTRAGALGPDAALRALPVVDAERDRIVIDEEIGLLRSMDEALVTDPTRPAFRRYVAARLAPHLKALGPAAGKREEASAMLEHDVTLALGELAEDDATLKQAGAVALAWLKDPNGVDPDLASVDVVLASHRAGPERIDALRVALQHAATPEARTTALRALGGFSGDAVARALDVTLTDDVRAQDLVTVLRVAVARRASRKAAFDWISQRWEALAKKIPSAEAGYFFRLPEHLCSKDERPAVAAFFQAHTKDVEGGDRPLAEALEEAALCEALRDKYASSVTRFLAAPPAPAAPRPAPVAAPPATKGKPRPHARAPSSQDAAATKKPAR